jgi:hypothetical protein
VNFENRKGYNKISAEFSYKISYAKRGKGVDFRFFAGKQYTDLTYNPYGFNFSDRNAISGTNDYAYDNYYLGRSDNAGLLNKQYYVRDGGFKVYTPFGAYKKSMLCMNINVDFPTKLPLSFFADFGTANGLQDDLKNAYSISSSISYDAGITLTLLKNCFSISMPLLVSEEIKKYEDIAGISFGERIRFMFNINSLNPLLLRNKLINDN